MDSKRERTFIIIKHDGVQRSLIGEITKRIERTGLKITAMKMFKADEKSVLDHYGKDDAWCLEKGTKTVENLKSAGRPVEKEAIEYGRDIIRALVKFMTCGPIVAMVVEGSQAVGVVKKLVGGTEPLTSDVGTIRGDLTTDSYQLANLDSRSVRNLIHCTDKVEEAEREINIWFKPEEIMNYTHINEKVLHDINLDGIFE